MRIFITGIAGFIGFHLAKALKARGDFVVGCDNFNTYYDPDMKRRRAALLKQLGVEVVTADVSQIEELVRQYDISHMVHLAAQAGVRYSLQNPQTYVDQNLDRFVTVLETIRRHPHIPLIYASSSSVYGLNQKIPFSETDRTDAPSNLYGATKKANELMAHAYHHLFGISVTGLRYFTVYGPWGRPDMAYFSFAKSICEGKLISIYNHGNMERDFTYIDDIIAGTIAAIDLGAPCELFNLGHHQPRRILDLVTLLENQLGKTAQLQLLPDEKTEIPITYADITKSEQALGFHPTVTLEEGVGRFVRWFQEWQTR